jgi:hypothetical protein
MACHTVLSISELTYRICSHVLTFKPSRFDSAYPDWPEVEQTATEDLLNLALSCLLFTESALDAAWSHLNSLTAFRTLLGIQCHCDGSVGAPMPHNPSPAINSSRLSIYLRRVRMVALRLNGDHTRESCTFLHLGEAVPSGPLFPLLAHVYLSVWSSADLAHTERLVCSSLQDVRFQWSTAVPCTVANPEAILRALSGQLGHLHSLELVGRSSKLLPAPDHLLSLHYIRYLLLDSPHEELTSPAAQHLLSLPNLSRFHWIAHPSSVYWFDVLLLPHKNTKGLSHLAVMELKAPVRAASVALQALGVIRSLQEFSFKAWELEDPEGFDLSQWELDWKRLGDHLYDRFRDDLRSIRLSGKEDTFADGQYGPFSVVLKCLSGISSITAFDCTVPKLSEDAILSNFPLDVVTIAAQWPHLEHLGISFDGSLSGEEGDSLAVFGTFMDMVRPFPRLRSLRCGSVRSHPSIWKRPSETHCLEFLDVSLNQMGYTWSANSNHNMRRDLAYMVEHLVKCFPNIRQITVQGKERHILTGAVEVIRCIQEGRKSSDHPVSPEVPLRSRVGDLIMHRNTASGRCEPCLASAIAFFSR